MGATNGAGRRDGQITSAILDAIGGYTKDKPARAHTIHGKVVASLGDRQIGGSTVQTILSRLADRGEVGRTIASDTGERWYYPLPALPKSPARAPVIPRISPRPQPSPVTAIRVLDLPDLDDGAALAAPSVVPPPPESVEVPQALPAGRPVRLVLGGVGINTDRYIADDDQGVRIEIWIDAMEVDPQTRYPRTKCVIVQDPAELSRARAWLRSIEFVPPADTRAEVEALRAELERATQARRDAEALAAEMTEAAAAAERRASTAESKLAKLTRALED